MTQARRLRPCLAAVLAPCLVAVAAARAEPLPKEACEAVVNEHTKLTEAGLPDLVKKGPAWVKANLGDARSQEVARYIRLHEDLLFRCGYDKLKALPGADNDDAADDKTAAHTPPPLPTRKPPTPEHFKRPPTPASVSAAAGGGGPPRPHPKPRRKPKIDDAYRPPPKAPAPQ